MGMPVFKVGTRVHEKLKGGVFSKKVGVVISVSKKPFLVYNVKAPYGKIVYEFHRGELTQAYK